MRPLTDTRKHYRLGCVVPVILSWSKPDFNYFPRQLLCNFLKSILEFLVTLFRQFLENLMMDNFFVGILNIFFPRNFFFCSQFWFFCVEFMGIRVFFRHPKVFFPFCFFTIFYKILIFHTIFCSFSAKYFFFWLFFAIFGNLEYF